MNAHRRAHGAQLTNHWVFRASILGFLIGLAACGGGGGGGSSGSGSSGGQVDPSPTTKTPLATLASGLFPLDANGVAVYATTAGTESVVVRVAGTQLLADGQGATLFRRQDPVAAADSFRAYASSATGLRQYAAAGADAIERAFDGSYVMRWPAYAGDTHVQLDTTIDSGMDFDGDGRPDRVALHAQVTILGTETITTAAGAFANAVHHQQVLRQTVQPSSGKAEQQLVTTTDTWFAPGVGIVRQAQASQGLGAGSPVTLNLIKYRFGSRSNENDAPSLQSVQPATGSPAMANARVIATFNEEMDEATITPASFAVTGPDGRAVAGVLQVSGRSVRFTPAEALASGNYLLTVSTAVQDLFGRHPSIDMVSSFVVDAARPQIVATWPAADAINVSLTTSISVSLSEMPAIESVTGANVQLTLDGAAVPATVRAVTNAISIEPLGALARGRHYEVAVTGVTDTAGNPLVQSLRFGFDTTPGRFGEPERVLAADNGSIGANSLAAGDVTGDGIPDIVYADLGAERYPDAVYLRVGRADGQLAPPVKLDLSTYFNSSSTRRCPITGLAIGDLNGDGRADVAVSSWNCGVLVLAQTAAGTLEPRQFLDELIQVLRIADINGDGRLDLVGVQNYWNKAFVWLQKPDGSLVLDQTPGLGDVAGRDVAIGDMNGDGRPDLVVALRTEGADAAKVALLLQQPDGRFSAPRYLRTGLSDGVWGIAVGDFNGDGRLDIAGTTQANRPASLLLFLQAADGGFPGFTTLPTMDGAYAVVAGDINGDGRMDLVVQHEGWSQVGLYLQKPSGQFAPEELYGILGRSVSIQSLALADVNRDGLQDIIGPASLLRQVPLEGSGVLGFATRGWRKASGRSGSR